MVKSLAAIAGLTSLLSISSHTLAQTTLPSDPQTTNCNISQSDLSKWFVQDSITKNGLVNPADSLTFPQDNTKCTFYKWSSQMFLWLTSASDGYKGGDYIFDSEVFFDVSTESTSGSTRYRTLIPNTQPTSLAVRKGKVEEGNGLVELIGEFGQAGGGGALLSQPMTAVSTGSSLVYYGVHVNNVYSEFLNWQAKGNGAQTEFLNTASAYKALMKYAKKDIPASEALTIELKTSWVDASTVKTPSDYILMPASVPKFSKNSTNTEWVEVAGKTEKKTLALVGMHIVGTVLSHPEMVWATFEHKNNSPMEGYFYKNAQDKLSHVASVDDGDWLFYAKQPHISGYNLECATVKSGGSDGTLIAKKQLNPAYRSSKSISTDNPKFYCEEIEPSNTKLANPWGSSSDLYVSKDDIDSIAENNAELISLNNDIMNQLKDVRKNYFQVGAVWEQTGVVPTSTKKYTSDYHEIGSLSLANSTMETYYQIPTPNNNGTVFPVSCFSCHNTFGGDNLGISHIYSDLINGLTLPSAKK